MSGISTAVGIRKSMKLPARSWPCSSYDELLVERAADALGDAAVDLALDDGRVHDRAAVVLDDVLPEA